jgi:hypothetical protein
MPPDVGLPRLSARLGGSGGLARFYSGEFLQAHTPMVYPPTLGR